MYHYVRDLALSRYPKINGLDLHLFRKQIKFLKKHFRLITTDQLLEAYFGNNELPDSSALLTFDDGYIDHYTNVFPILKEEDIQGFFSMPAKPLVERKLLDVNKIHFVIANAPTEKLLLKIFELLNYYRGKEHNIPSNEELYQKLAKKSRFDSAEIIFIKRLLQAELNEQLRNQIVTDLFSEYLPVPEEVFAAELYINLDQVRLMRKEGMCFGIHGYEHYWMNGLSQKDLEADINSALEVFDGIVDRNNWICCYPYGSYNDDVIHLIRKKGAVIGLTTDVNIAILDYHDRYKLPRLDTNDFPPKSFRYKDFLVIK